MSPRQNGGIVFQRIILATIEIIAKKHILGLRIRDVAKKANVGLGHLNYYFPTKAALLSTVLDTINQEFIKARERRKSNQDSLDSIENFCAFFEEKEYFHTQLQDCMIAYYQFWSLSNQNSEYLKALNENYNIWRSDINEVIRDGVIKGVFDDKYANLVPQLMVGIMEGAAIQYPLDPAAFNLSAYFEGASTMILMILGIDRSELD